MKYYLSIIPALLLLQSTAFAADYKIATVDISKVINSSKDAKKAKLELEAESAKAKKLVEEKRTALKPLEEKANQGEIKPGTKEGEEIKAKTRELVELMRKKEDELRASYSKANKGIAEKTNSVIAAYSKEKDISLVLDKGAAPSGTAVLFGDEAFDITDDIISRVNE